MMGASGPLEGFRTITAFLASRHVVLLRSDGDSAVLRNEPRSARPLRKQHETDG
jgi:hypothetical protein